MCYCGSYQYHRLGQFLPVTWSGDCAIHSEVNPSVTVVAIYAQVRTVFPCDLVLRHCDIHLEVDPSVTVVAIYTTG